MNESDISRVIEMAWEDRTPFDAIEAQFGLNEQGVKQLMRDNLKSSSYQSWRKRVQGRPTIWLKGVSVWVVINPMIKINFSFYF
jgi:uncharacterized protein (TIGR03643 family)